MMGEKYEGKVAEKGREEQGRDREEWDIGERKRWRQEETD